VRHALLVGVITLLISGCGIYIPPGAKADLQAFAPPNIQAGFAANPTNPFPARIAVVRVQAPTYTNYYLSHIGTNTGGTLTHVVLVETISDFGACAGR